MRYEQEAKTIRDRALVRRTPVDVVSCTKG